MRAPGEIRVLREPAVRWRTLLGLLLLAQVAIGLYGIAQPVTWGHQGYHVAEHGLSARNLLEHGAWMPSHHAGPGSPSPDSVTYHHPFLLHPYVALATMVFGEAPWVSRAVQLCFGLLALLGLWTLVARVRDRPSAALASLAFVVTPLNVAFLNLPDHQLIAIAYVLWSCVGLVAWLESAKTSALFLWLGFGLLAGFTDWPWYPVALLLFLQLAWQTLRGEHAGWHEAITARRMRWALVAFALVVLVPFLSHMGAAYSSTRWDDLMVAYAERGASSPAGHFLSNTGWRLYAMHSFPLVIVTWWWLWTTMRSRAGDLGSQIFLALFWGQTFWLFLMPNEFLVHEYRSYWYVGTAAFACGDLGVRWYRHLRQDATRPRLQRYALSIVLVSLVGWSVAHLRHNLVTSRRMAGSVSFQGYEPQHEFMTAARVVHAMTRRDRDVVLIGGGLGPRKEAEYLLDRRVQVIWSPDEAHAAIAQGASVVVIDGVEGLREHPGWRPLFWRARSLRIGSCVILDLRGGAKPAIDAVDLVLGPDFDSLNAWLHAPLTGPLQLSEASTDSALWLTRQLASPDNLVDSARVRGDVTEGLPEGVRALLSKGLNSEEGAPRSGLHRRSL